MIDYHDRMQTALTGIDSPTKRVVRFLSVLGSMLQEKGAKLPTVVGGAALEIFTLGQYMSHDIDIKSDFEMTMFLLRSMGLRNEGRSLIYSEECDILLWAGRGLRLRKALRLRIGSCVWPFQTVTSLFSC